MDTLTATWAPPPPDALPDAPAGYAVGMLVPWDAPGDTSAGRLSVDRGAIAVPGDLSRVKLFAGHDRERPAGYLIDVQDTPRGLFGAFRLADTGLGRDAAAELAEQVRDGLSVELSGLDITDDRVTAGRLDGVALVTVPAYPDARGQHLAAAADDTATMTAATDPDPDPVPMGDTMTATTADTPAPTPAAPAVEAPPAAELVAAATTRPVSAVAELARHVGAAYSRGGATAAGGVLTAALADISPGGNGVGNEAAALGIQAAGELVADLPDPLYDMCVMGRALAGMRVHAWRWSTPPQVGDYAGNKAEIPTNAAAMEYVEVTASRLAGGHDLDRIYVDLGASDALVSYWRLMVADVAAKLDAKRLAAVQADATTGTSVDLATALAAGLAAVPDATYYIISTDLWQAEGAKAFDTVPAILSGEGIFGPGLPGEAIVSPDLVSTVIVGKRSARDFYTVDPPIRLEAVNIPNAGVDAGAYSYYAPLTVQADGVYVDTVTPVGQAAGQGKRK